MYNGNSIMVIRSRTSRLLYSIRQLAAVAATGLLLCLMALPALADDDDVPAPPTAQQQAAAARWTIGAVSLLAGFGVYYFVQRHRVLHSKEHSPDWDKKMGFGVVASALVSTALVWTVLSVLSRPAPQPTRAAPTPNPAAAPRIPTNSQ